MAKHIDGMLASKFVCSKCEHRGGHVERLSMAGTGLSRLFEIQPHKYAFVSCENCGYTEVYSLKVLEGADNAGMLLDIIFAD